MTLEELRNPHQADQNTAYLFISVRCVNMKQQYTDFRDTVNASIDLTNVWQGCIHIGRNYKLRDSAQPPLILTLRRDCDLLDSHEKEGTVYPVFGNRSI